MYKILSDLSTPADDFKNSSMDPPAQCVIEFCRASMDERSIRLGRRFQPLSLRS